MFSIGDDSRVVFSVVFVNVNGWFSTLCILTSILLWPFFSFVWFQMEHQWWLQILSETNLDRRYSVMILVVDLLSAGMCYQKVKIVAWKLCHTKFFQNLSLHQDRTWIKGLK